MERTCSLSKRPFTVTDDEQAFLTEKIGFTFGGKTIRLPSSPYHPDVRTLIRTAHRNERFLYKNQSSFSGKDIISIYAETPVWGEPYKVYTEDEWRSDSWDPMEYGKDIDFSQSFFAQFAKLQKDVPRIAVITVGNENAAYTTGTGYCRNCYLINSSENCEDCYYGKLLQACTDSMDCSYLYDSQFCYECFSCSNCYGSRYLAFSHNCNDCYFSSNLNACTNCCLCTNLSHKEYHFLNEPLDKAEYEKRVQEFRGSQHLTEEMKKLYLQRLRESTQKYANIVNSENCTGDYIENSRNCLDSYDVTNGEDCRYVQVGVNVKDLYHCSNMYLKPELCYETLGTIEVFNCAYCIFVFHSQNLLYCDYCFNCNDCFGCTGLTRKQYCIFNKQYTKEEYEDRVPGIIEYMKEKGEWGLFLPPQYAPFGYNESLASEYEGLNEDEARAMGFHWRPKDIKDYRPQTCEIPKNISEADDSITQEILCCTDCKKNFRIIPQEFAHYKQHTIAIPHKCSDCRHEDRMQLRNPRTLWERQCAGCNKEVQSTFAPQRNERILCEKCYQKEVF